MSFRQVRQPYTLAEWRKLYGEKIMSELWTLKENILNEVLDSLEKRYPSGLYDWLYLHDRALYDQINVLEGQLNRGFADGYQVDNFKATLREYWKAHMKGIRLFNKSGQSTVNLSSSRAERIAEKEAACA